MKIMKATGIIRRIDDLGRVVIPKEIRRTLRIREGDPLEIFLEEDCICFKKYSALGSLDENTLKIAQTMAQQAFKHQIAIYDDIYKIFGPSSYDSRVDVSWEKIELHSSIRTWEFTRLFLMANFMDIFVAPKVTWAQK